MGWPKIKNEIDHDVKVALAAILSPSQSLEDMSKIDVYRVLYWKFADIRGSEQEARYRTMLVYIWRDLTLEEKGCFYDEQSWYRQICSLANSLSITYDDEFLC